MNKNIWNLYKSSDRGKEAIDLFTFNEEKDNLETKVKEIFQKYNEYLGGQDIEDYFIDGCFLIIDNVFANKLFLEENENSTDYFIKLIDNLEIYFVEANAERELVRIENERPIITQKDYKTFCAMIPEISLMLYLYGEVFYFPILFREQFDVFMKSLDILNIPIPELPAKSNKRGRLLLYNDLNNNIVKFAEDNALTPEETCAYVYDFALMLLEEENVQSEMPEPTNVWLTGGSKEDYALFLKDPIKGAKSVWTCNENTKRGDIIIMYVRSPYSCIQSIWRADIDGVYTPFVYYNS